MIINFFSFLKQNNIPFSLINSCVDVVALTDMDLDIDILFKKQNFMNIEKIIKIFCQQESLQIVQVLHVDLWAKNIFLYNPKRKEFLNLYLYGELSLKEIVFFDENEIFNTLETYENTPILSPEKEFIYYLVKRLDKDELYQDNFEHLLNLFLKNEKICTTQVIKFFPLKHTVIIDSFRSKKYDLIIEHQKIINKDIKKLKKQSIKRSFFDTLRTIKCILNPTGVAVSFLGPDGSGKSTIIDALVNTRLPFRRKDYFHLKPIITKNNLDSKNIVTDPHKYPPYSKVKSYIKLLYFIYQYNIGWLKNIAPLKIRSSLVIFDRYFDDILVDTKRYRYGGSLSVAKLARMFIPKPDIYFILTSEAKVIYKRKQEVPYEELERQIKGYEALVDGNRYVHINVNRSPEEIVNEIKDIILERLNG